MVLSTGERGVVLAANPNDSTRPMVLIDQDHQGRPASYVVALPSLGRRFGPVSLERLVAVHYRYDVFYCCGP